MESIIGAIAILFFVGLAVVVFLGTDAGDSCCMVSVALLMLIGLGALAVVFLLFFGIGCAAVIGYH